MEVDLLRVPFFLSFMDTLSTQGWAVSTNPTTDRPSNSSTASSNQPQHTQQLSMTDGLKRPEIQKNQPL